MIYCLLSDLLQLKLFFLQLFEIINKILIIFKYFWLFKESYPILKALIPMISFYKIRVGFPEIRIVYHLMNKIVIWQQRYKTNVPPTENLPSCRLVQE